MTVEMDIYKKLEVYWRNLAQSAWAGNWSGEKAKGEEGGVSFSSETDIDSRSSILTLASLLMFARATEIILPQYTTNFEGKAAKNYWSLLTKPIHFDLNRDFEDSTYTLEKRSLGIYRPRTSDQIPFHTTQDAMRSNVLINLESKTETERQFAPLNLPASAFPTPPHAQAAPSSSSSSSASPSAASLQSSPHPGSPASSATNTSGATSPRSPGESRLEASSSASASRSSFVFPSYHQQPPSYDHKAGAALVTTHGRLFDPLDDFMRVKFTSATDLVNLLEYGAAFLIGLLIMEKAEITEHFALNCRRILNDLIWLRKDQLTPELASRLVNCATIMAFYYAATSQWGILSSVLLFAHTIASEHQLHQRDPIITARVHLTLLWFARTQGEREYYMRICSSDFPCEQGIDFRCKFSYVSASLRSQKMDEPCTDTGESAEEFWERVASYLDDCDRAFELLDKFGLAPHSLLYFKSLACVMRAELGPRVRHPEWTVEQGMLLQKELGGLSDIHTLAALSQLKSFCADVTATTAPFIYHSKTTTVSKYILSILDQISVAPPLSAPEAAILSVGASSKPTFPTPQRHSDPGERFVASQQVTPIPSTSSMDISTEFAPSNC
jgi:hypothetical protein